eukprot:jgi/Astpho2/5550/Aster-02810
MRPRVKPWDLEEGFRSLAYHSSLYCRAQAMRKDGKTPANHGMVDDLPVRLAAEQLHTLAGMSQKVQEAIQHSRKVFEHQQLLSERGLLRKVLKGWLTHKQLHVGKRLTLARAVARIRRSTLSRCFHLWRDRFGEVDDYARKRKQCELVVRHGLLRRCFAVWQHICEERDWKTQLATRDNEIRRLDREASSYRKLEMRPVYVMSRRRLRRCLEEWQVQARLHAARKQRAAQAAQMQRRHLLENSFVSWLEGSQGQHHRCRRQQGLHKKLQKAKLLRIVGAWTNLVGSRARKQKGLHAAAALYQHHQQGKAWSRWLQLHARALQRQAAERGTWQRPRLACSFYGWLEEAKHRRRVRALQRQNVAKRSTRQAHCDLAVAHAQLAQQRAENERLRRDNERFVRLIDSGEWGRGRVSELMQAGKHVGPQLEYFAAARSSAGMGSLGQLGPFAHLPACSQLSGPTDAKVHGCQGEVLKGERDALLKLVQALRREYEAVQLAKTGQQAELQSIKERMLAGGSARNRMLVKGGSSFNALVRALKQDVVTGAAPKAIRNEQLMYDVDRLSMDHVAVFPDGELNVQAARSRDASPVFRQPRSAAVQRVRVPSELAAMGACNLGGRAASMVGGRSHAVARGSPAETQTAQVRSGLAVEAAGVPAQQTVLVVPRERDASLDVACQLLDLQTAVLVPAASQASQLTSSGPQAAVSSPPALVVGHLMKPSRERDLASRGLLPLVPQHGISFVPIDTALLLEQQGPFDALLHKATDDLVSRGPGQLPAFSASVLALEAYCRAHPQTRIIEPLAMLEQLTSLPPPDELLGRLSAAGISLPAIFKSAVACGVAEAHKMAIALRPEGLSEVDVPMPACVQPFVDHGAVIHKIYAAGGQAELGLLLFGFDLIIDAEGRLFIIDVNYFPSFKGINAAPAALAAAIRGRCCTAS